MNVNGTNSNDEFQATPAAENFIGGNGSDRVTYTTDNGDSSVTVDMTNPLNSTGDAAGDTFDSIERFLLQPNGDNVFIGDADAQFVISRNGDDILSGGGGNDNLRGNNGNDILIGGTGSDRMFGGAGNDRFELSAGDQFGDVISGFSGADTIAFVTDGAFNLNQFAFSGIEAFSLESTNGIALTVQTGAQFEQIETAFGANDVVTITGTYDYDFSAIQTAVQLGIEAVNFTDSFGAEFAISQTGVDEIEVDKTTNAAVAFDSIVDDIELSTGTLLTRTIDYSASRGDLTAVAEFDLGPAGADGVLDRRTVSDDGGNRAFSTQVTDFNGNGVRTQTVTTFDERGFAGDVETRTYADGQLASKVLEDTGGPDANGNDTNGNQNYDTIETLYDTSTGRFTVRTQTNDDGRQIIKGGSQDNVISGGSEDDRISGGGGSDVFVFSNGNGKDIISDFDVLSEQVDLTAYGVDSIDDLNSLNQNGRVLVLNIDGTNTVGLIDVDADDFSDANFVSEAAVLV